MAKEQKVKPKKTVKKSFYEVSAPVTATKIQLYAASPEELVGQIVRLDLTKNLRGKNLELKLKVKNNDNELFAEPVSVQLLSAYLKRVVRKGTDYAEDSFEVECRDCDARIKPLLVTRRRVSRSILNELRINARKFLEGHVKTRNGGEIISEIITNKLQKQLSLKLKKVYPLALCEIRMFEIGKARAESDSEKEKN